MSDCKLAIDLAKRFSQVRGHNAALARLKKAIKKTSHRGSKVKVAWVPGHAGVDSRLFSKSNHPNRERSTKITAKSLYLQQDQQKAGNSEMAEKMGEGNGWA